MVFFLLVWLRFHRQLCLVYLHIGAAGDIPIGTGGLGHELATILHPRREQYGVIDEPLAKYGWEK